MKSANVYRILTYILLPFGAILTLNALNSLLSALSNPILLIFTFVMACVPLYIFTSSYFFFNGVQKAKPCKASLKEWIKVNAVVSIIFAVIMFLCSFMIMAVLTNPQMITNALNQMTAQQAQVLNKMTPGEIVRLLKIFTAIMLPFSTLLIVHIVMTFGMLKRYNHVFDRA